MTKQKYKITILSLIAVIFITTGFSCKLFPSKSLPGTATKTIELSYWGVWDDSDFLQPLIDNFRALHPKIKITYRKFKYSEYEQQLLEAWAEDRGPDIYSLPAGWLKKYQNRITPQPDQIQLAFQETKKTLGKTEITTTVRSVPTFKASDIKNQFVDVVYEDILIDGKIYGLPYSVDSLVLFYNRELLDAAGIATPPKTWEEVQTAVKALTLVDKDNNLIQSGISLGTANNISNAVDIVSLLMIQNGTTMIDERGGMAFHKSATNNSKLLPGLEALRFYTDFADSFKEVYSWNSDEPNNIDAFVSGRLAMMFGYSYYLPVIKGRAPKLDIGISFMPQIQESANPINYTNYWVETVSHKTENAEAAWGFLNFASRQNQIVKYLDVAKKPSALRELVNAQKEDPELTIFANQTLTAKRWYRGADDLKMNEIFSELITSFADSLDPEQLLEYTASRINQIK